MFTFGSDPEVFLSLGGKIANAVHILPGKENMIREGGTAVYHDNALAEMQVEPGSNSATVVANIRKAFVLLSSAAPRHRIEVDSSHWFSMTDLNDEESRTAGCNSEYCAYTLEQVFPPHDVIRNTGFRTAGGHIHLGGHKLLSDASSILHVVRMLDLFVGIPSVFLDKDPHQLFRRKIYGQAGSHRLPDHGLEYRCLGNFWLKSPLLVELVFDLAEFTLDFVDAGGHKNFWLSEESFDGDGDQSELCFGYDARLLRSAINTCDRSKAENFMHIVDCNLPKDLASRINLFKDSRHDFYDEWGISCSDS